MGLAPLVVPAIALPIGISFFTFHAFSYVVDVKRGDAVAQQGPSGPKSGRSPAPAARTPGGADGRGLYFVDAEGRLNAVDVLLSPRVEIGVPKPLGIQVPAGVEGQPYDVAPDGRRFVLLRRRGEATGGSRLIVTVDWLE